MPAFSESTAGNSNADRNPSVDLNANSAQLAEARARLLEKLKAKLTNYKGEPVSVVIFNPMDYTTTQVGPIVLKNLEESLKLYGDLKIKTEQFQIENLTLEEFRTAMTRFRADVLILPVLKSTNFDLYIYDRRTPYYIYAHSEAIPELTQLQIAPEAGAYYAKLVLRRTLYRFINDQYFELPRQETAPVLQSEIPRWIASKESLQTVNHEILSRFYAGVSTGTAISLGVREKWWNAPLLSVSLGYRVWDKLFMEMSLETSSYNVAVGALKYVFENKSSPFRVGVGLGAAYATNRLVWVVDETFGFGPSSIFAVPSVNLLFPIGDVYLTLEAKSFIGIDQKKFLWTFGPGIAVHF